MKGKLHFRDQWLSMEILQEYRFLVRNLGPSSRFIWSFSDLRWPSTVGQTVWVLVSACPLVLWFLKKPFYSLVKWGCALMTVVL